VIGLATLAGALAILRWLAPQLIGLPVDLRLVAVSDAVPPFYDGVFRSADYRASGLLLNDPITVVRAAPRRGSIGPWGPNDLLGFRNAAVPNVADVVAIGDSQTYGNGVLLEQSWQYLEMARRVPVFEPQATVVAYYTGNDAVESFRVAYGVERFHDLRPDLALGPGDAPPVRFPAPPSDLWPVTFPDGVRTVFTPRLRLEANERVPALDAGYEIMARAAAEIRRITAPRGVQLIFTVIPTKELVYATKIARDRIVPIADYVALVGVERERLQTLAGALSAVEGAVYVDVLEPLERAALAGVALYPRNHNGHPAAPGHQVIADALAAALDGRVLARPLGFLSVGAPAAQGGHLYLATAQGLWHFPDLETARAAGWQPEDANVVSFRSVAGLRRLGEVAPEAAARFGPRATP
jgi:hypothetical protein